MPPAHDIAAHQTYLDIWQKALDSPKGIRVMTSNPIDFRARLYHARAADRRNNKLIYPPDSNMHGKSFYDGYVVYKEKDAVRIVPSDIEIAGVEQL